MARGGRRADAIWGLSKDVINGGCVGKHGLGVKVRWYGICLGKRACQKALGSWQGLHKSHVSFEIEMFAFYDKGVYDRICEG